MIEMVNQATRNRVSGAISFPNRVWEGGGKLALAFIDLILYLFSIQMNHSKIGKSVLQLSRNIKYHFKLWIVLLLIAELTLSGIGFCGHTHHSHSEDQYAHADIHEAFSHVLTFQHAGENDDAPETSHCQPIFHCPCHNGTLGITTQFYFSPIVEFETFIDTPEFTSYLYWPFPLERPPLAFC